MKRNTKPQAFKTPASSSSETDSHALETPALFVSVTPVICSCRAELGGPARPVGCPVIGGKPAEGWKKGRTARVVALVVVLWIVWRRGPFPRPGDRSRRCVRIGCTWSSTIRWAREREGRRGGGEGRKKGQMDCGWNGVGQRATRVENCERKRERREADVFFKDSEAARQIGREAR
ncbi:uncharacterized protein J3D65DRAFT_44898 [Phyllosticta citribraziliensis]|uniref:Uncharacterized protein n=1 Tax=Phyllosticta citribraziliensis TaxID=989973 RepID=A0ABR1MCM8_9PEZI